MSRFVGVSARIEDIPDCNSTEFSSIRNVPNQPSFVHGLGYLAGMIIRECQGQPALQSVEFVTTLSIVATGALKFFIHNRITAILSA